MLTHCYWKTPRLVRGKLLPFALFVLVIQLASGVDQPVHLTNAVQLAFLKASNAGRENFFGTSVAVFGRTVLVGAYGEESKSTGVNGTLPNTGCWFAGAAYVFEQDGDEWVQRAYLKPATNQVCGQFGVSVAIWGDTAVIGSNELCNSNRGSAYVFARTGGTWKQHVRLQPRASALRDEFGFAVAISESTIIVGAPQDRSMGHGVNVGVTDNSGISVGAAYVYANTGQGWQQQAYLKPVNSDRGFKFGSAVAISGDTVVVGSPKEYGKDGIITGGAHVFIRDNGVWREQAHLKASNPKPADEFGRAVSIAGDTILVGAPGRMDGDWAAGKPYLATGAAFVFVRRNSQWNQEFFFSGSAVSRTGYFGQTVAVSDDLFVIGSSSLAHLFSKRSGIWKKVAEITGAQDVKGDRFGESVAISHELIAVGAPYHGLRPTPRLDADAVDPLSKSGAAYIFSAK